MTSYKTEKELRQSIPAIPPEGRNSTICALCGYKGGSSIGNHTYSQTHAYWWWHCRNCRRDYDLRATEHTLPPGMKSPFDKAKKSRKKIRSRYVTPQTIC